MTRILWFLLLAAAPAYAHVGSPDVFVEGNAGPYPLFVTIRPPAVIPGVAGIEIRARDGSVRRVRITPMPLTGDGARFAPAPDAAQPAPGDPRYFTGSLWMMATGSWQVRVDVEGEKGPGTLSIPVPAIAQRSYEMPPWMAAVLLTFMVLLSVALISIVGAAAREAQIEPGERPHSPERRRGRRAIAVASVLVIAALLLGREWWRAEALQYGRNIFKPLTMAPSYRKGLLQLRLRDPGWLAFRKIDDFLPDHGHLMHLYVIRLPEMERVWHLHPDMTASGVFERRLPAMPAGRYALFADVVHENGLPETLTAEIELPLVDGVPLEGDDSTAELLARSKSYTNSQVYKLAGGGRMIWTRDPAGYKPGKSALFEFRVEDDKGNPVNDLELYMGMPAHAAFVRRDRLVFAHVHPGGSVPMAALSLLENAPADPHAGHAMTRALPAGFAFPYGFPSPGEYRIFVQVKRTGKVETAAFDVVVVN